ncbi:MAG: carboxypeptidase-like regulatory domain-containing protein, partial [Candidatus Marinimicrobia bacterium]|nr:carboxypeptidase-like regulatory domain-containing protein [Candidatus Neomarinimicrobiota bacterium]
MKTIKYILLLFFIIAVNAQEMSTISGFVRDDATGEPISYANVFLSETSIGSATNVDG